MGTLKMASKINLPLAMLIFSCFFLAISSKHFLIETDEAKPLYSGNDGALGVDRKGFATGYGKRNQKNRRNDYCIECGSDYKKLPDYLKNYPIPKNKKFFKKKKKKKKKKKS